MTAAATAPETRSFEAEVGKLLHIVANSLYSEREVFLRELISNASDACDRLRYTALTQPDLLTGDAGLKVTVSADRKAGTLTVADNGIGMDHDALVSDLGTIARSGTSEYLRQLGDDDAKDVSLIGQFGVGFYSAFMVADEVTVRSRRAGDSQGWEWRSDGKGSFTVAPAEGEVARGTEITLHMRKDAKEFLEEARLRHIIKAYSDHIALPIELATSEGADTVNTASALWTRPRKDITPEQYQEFYHHVAHAFDEPWMTIHNRVEGKLEYTNLLFVPTQTPLDLFHPDRRCAVKLYVRRVFITDDCEELLPSWLRFVRGIVDSEDIPLNISREMLQNNPVVAKIRRGLVKRVLGEFEKKADKASGEYARFWDAFGPVIKEGIYEDFEYRDRLIKLARFRSTVSDELISLDDYVGRMKDGQDKIYYITGDAPESVRRSPQLEAFAARGVEVLMLTDPVDEFWIPAVGTHAEKSFQSVTRSGVDLGAIAPLEAREEEDETGDGQGDVDALIACFRLELKDAVKDVRASSRLTDSPVCLVADEGDLDMHIERMLKQHQRVDTTSSRILEINPKHPLIRGLARAISEGGGGDGISDAAFLLLDQARIVEGEPLTDPAAFARRLSTMLQKGYGS
jgi:molecular chaperone HtpG